MNQEDRLDPDALLAAINNQDKTDNEAKLRIFLGMSAGVGKTFAMLKAAHQRLAEGVDVVIGVVETHGRSETAALLEGLPTITKKKSEYRGTDLEEMDLDEILRRKPGLVIVDELAHTNTPGSRHEKRYQDVLELLDAGIHVYTALNVQHLESRKDAAEAITGIPIRETVPDSILERASQVELVDIAPSELLKRLKEGRVYLGDKAQRAAENFFKEDKLTALREIALRITAERVDQDLQQFVSIRQDRPWQANDRLLVAISHSPYSEKLIRATRRLAYNLEAPWIALHVDTGIVLNDDDQAQLTKNLTLARELKAEVITTADIDIASAMRRICRLKNVTQVIVGRPTRRWFRDIIEGGSLLNRLVKESTEVDVHVIRQENAAAYRPTLLNEIALYRSRTGPQKYWYTLMFIIAMSVVCGFIEPFIGYRTVGFLFLIAVLLSGLFGSIGAVVFSAALSGLVWDFFFIPPKLTFLVNSPEDFMLLVSYFVVALFTGFLTNRIRFHEKLIREREERTQVLYQSLQDIANSAEKSVFLVKICERIGKVINAKCGVFLKTEDGKLVLDGSKPYSYDLSDKEQAVADWCFRNQKPAGWSTDTISQSDNLFVPLRGTQEIVGVFAIKPNKKSRKLDLEQENLLYSLTRQLAQALERHFFAKRIAEARRLRDSEELHQTLLNSISHEMRTPLTAVMSVAQSLQDPDVHSKSTEVKALSVNLLDAGDRLNRVIENLLDMSRLNSGVLALKQEWQDLSDLVGVTLAKMRTPLRNNEIVTVVEPDLPLAFIDLRMMEHALSNLLVNASMYSDPGSQITVRLETRHDFVVISVEDLGPGIPKEHLPKLFEKFYRIPGSRTGGTGLGLSIVKSIVDLHKGQIYVEPVEPHGSRFVIALPKLAQPPRPLETSSSTEEKNS
jgi:two-component system sensor histidine kinase KdpD